MVNGIILEYIESRANFRQAIYKFVPLVYQIVSRLGDSDASQDGRFQDGTDSDEMLTLFGRRFPDSSCITDFYPSMCMQPAALEALIFELARAHPYHCLYQIFSVRNGDRVLPNARNADLFIPNPSRIEAARKLLKKLEGSSQMYGKLLSQMSKLLEAYLELSEKPPAGQERELPLTKKLGQIKNLTLVPIMTVELPVRKIAVKRYQDSLEL
eukprot:SAG11_NODE_3190_length_2623_cov_2.275357_3_plen_212_part_00